MQLARAIGETAASETPGDKDAALTPRQERAAKGGRARAKALTRAKRVAIAKKAAGSRKRH